MASTINASTSSGIVQTADTSGNLALQSNGTTKFTVASTGAYGQLISGTAVSASGTSVDFTSIPSWVKRITVMFNGVSTSGTSPYIIQLGAGSVTTSGYIGYGANTSGASVAGATQTVGIPLINAVVAANTYGGVATVATLGSNSWSASSTLGSSSASGGFGGGYITLGGTLDRIRITTVNGTDTFDAGSINILYEG